MCVYEYIYKYTRTHYSLVVHIYYINAMQSQAAMYRSKHMLRLSKINTTILHTIAWQLAEKSKGKKRSMCVWRANERAHISRIYIPNTIIMYVIVLSLLL
jgi:hypothetical protein